MDVVEYNREKWNRQVDKGNPWTVPCSPEVISAAREGNWSFGLTELKPMPREWLPQVLHGMDILCLASGGGQQGPILAAAGANVTVFDNSPRQLEQDRMVAEREGLQLVTVLGDMRNLSAFKDQSFDLIYHPVSNCFCPEVRPVWKESFRVLRLGGALLAGFNNPDAYIFDFDLEEQGIFEVKYPLPFDATKLDEKERQRLFREDDPLEFSHTLLDQIGGQLEAGFVLTGFYEDQTSTPIGKYIPGYFATRAIKPGK